MPDPATVDQMRNLLRALDAAGPVPRSEKYTLIGATLFASMVGALMGAVVSWRVIEDHAVGMKDRPAVIQVLPAAGKEAPRTRQPKYSREDD